MDSVTAYLRLLAGQLSYLTHSRPDIMTAVSNCATKSIAPTKRDNDRLLKIFGYLRQTFDYGITLSPNREQNNILYMTAYVDAAYMSHDDSGSHTGYTIALDLKNPVHFSTRKVQNNN